MGEPNLIVIDPVELERIAGEVVREVPGHMVASEVRKRIAARSVRKVKPSIEERAKRAVERLR